MQKSLNRTWRLLTAVVGLLTLATLPAAADEILGKKVLVKNPGSETQRSVVMLAKEDATDIGPLPDLPTAGAYLSIVVDAEVQQVIFLSPAGWSVIGGGYKYAGPIANEPVKKVLIKAAPGGKAMLKIILKGNVGLDDLTVVPPNPGTQIAFELWSGLTRYCTTFGGTAGGTQIADSATQWKILAPTQQPACPVASACCSHPGSNLCGYEDPYACVDASGVPAGGGAVCDSANGDCTMAPPIGGGDCCSDGTQCVSGPPISVAAICEGATTVTWASECTPTGCTASAATCSGSFSSCGGSCGGDGLCLAHAPDFTLFCADSGHFGSTVCASDASCPVGMHCFVVGFGGLCAPLCP